MVCGTTVLPEPTLAFVQCAIFFKIPDKACVNQYAISFNPCSIYPHCGILRHRSRTPNDFVESIFFVFRHVLYGSNIGEILLYNGQWVVITHVLICSVRAAFH